MDRIDTETIVREVVRRLESMIGSGTRPADPPAPASGGANPSGEGPGALRIHQRVVTLACLDGRLDRVATLHVPDRAILTPAVRDALASRGIAVRRDTLVEPAARPVLLASDAKGPVCPRQWQRRLGEGADRCDERGAAAIVDRMGAWIAEGGVGVWWTVRPARCACDANRDGRLRAAVAHDEESVEDAVRDAECDLLVIDPRVRRPQRWAAWIERLRRQPPRRADGGNSFTNSPTGTRPGVPHGA
ncbi:MAG: hypothetical protein FJ297_05750 [Planctomycetes bacterium]|nr:hypothetical protein [Planctomycetota bacterium]